jgi:hypothetical protein
VSQTTVGTWRKALGVPVTTEGTSRLRAEHFDEPWALKARAKAQAQRRDPELDGDRRAKVAASKRGKHRPRHVIEAMRAGRLGKPHSEATRRKMSEAQRRRRTRPPNAGPAWKRREDALLGTMPDPDVAQRTGRTAVAVRRRRAVLRIKRFLKGRSSRKRVATSLQGESA